MRALGLGLTGALAFAAAAGAAELRSEYTDIGGFDQCTTISSDDIGGTSVCAGLRGFPVVVSEGDLRQTVSYGVQAMDEKAIYQGFAPFNHIGQKIEWLVDASDKDNLQPVATILRWYLAGEDGSDKYQVLVVTQIKSGATCWIALVDALATRNANEVARKIAGERAGTSDCSGPPEQVEPYRLPADVMTDYGGE